MKAPVTAFVVAGGASRRMARGMETRDKALLVWRGRTLIEHAVAKLREVTPDVRVLCGPVRRYDEFGVPVVPDELCGVGPVAGLHAALHGTDAPLVLWLGVDLPLVTAETLRLVTDAARESVPVGRATTAGTVATTAVGAMAETSRGLEPLCAAFSTSAGRAIVASALERGRFKLTDAVGGEAAILRVLRPEAEFANVNAPEDASALGIAL